jgi:hypothetical protein
MSYSLPYFGTVDPEALNEYYDVQTEMAGQQLTIDINFDESSIAVEKLDLLKIRLDTLPALLARASDAVRASFKQEQDARKYIVQHMDLIDSPELQRGLRQADATFSNEEKLFALVRPLRIGLYPEDEESYFVFDFSISRELTNYLLVVVMSVDEKLQYVTTES